jgi:hypothetical protein
MKKMYGRQLAVASAKYCRANAGGAEENYKKVNYNQVRRKTVTYFHKYIFYVSRQQNKHKQEKLCTFI